MGLVRGGMWRDGSSCARGARRGLRATGLALAPLLLSACAASLEESDISLAPVPAREEVGHPLPARSAREEQLSFVERLRERLRQTFREESALRRREETLARQQRLGEDLAMRILKDARLADDARLRRRLRSLVARLAAATEQTRAHPWRVHLLDSARADAFTTGGGHLFITTGMVDLLKKDERIATVLAHEMAHNLMGHVLLAREKKELARRAQAFSREVISGDMKLDWLGKSVNFIVLTSLNTYSRQQEHEADAEGLDIMVRAGHAPQVALETFDYLNRHFRDEPAVRNFFYGIHPNYGSRRWHLANLIRAHYRRQAGLPPVRRGNWKGREEESLAR